MKKGKFTMEEVEWGCSDCGHYWEAPAEEEDVCPDCGSESIEETE